MKSNSFAHSASNGQGHSAYNGNGPFQVRHDWHCCCRWCLQGVR